MHRSARRRSIATGSTIVLLTAAIALPAATQGADPASVGSISGLFEERPGDPFCEAGEDTDGDGFVTCKPTAVSSAVLGDGQVVYWNGIENTEDNVDTLVLFEAGRVLKDSRVRGLDLRGDAPAFDLGISPGFNGDNPSQSYQVPLLENPLGVVGTGKPGDGLVGSTVGRIVSTDAAAPTDDPVRNDADMFCSDLSMLPNGQIIVAGGTDFYSTGAAVPQEVPGLGGMGVSEIGGIKTTQVFDDTTRTWSETDPMEFGRWYPTMTTMPNGDQLVVSGVTRLVADVQLGQVRLGELYDVSEQEWTTLDEAGLASETTLPMFPRVHLGPSGDLFYAAGGQMNGFGPTGYGADEALWGLYQFFDTETQQWEIAGATQWAGLVRNGNFSTPLLMEQDDSGEYSTMEILAGGGTLGPTPGSMVAMSLSEIITIDDENNVSSEATSTLNNPRWFSSGTLLPDGSVLASGGGTIDHVNASGLEGPVREMELFDPESRTWTPVLETQRDRVYHNTATLLQDGRVLIGGHSPIMLGIVASHQDFGGEMARNTKDPSFEIYSPPYLHSGDRPVIASAPALLEWGDDFNVQVPQDGEPIESFSLIRTPSVSHTVDADQRGLTLPVESRTGGNVTVDFSSVDGTVAPPGEYYLFALSEEGVPSVAAIVTVADDSVADAFAPGQLDQLRTAVAYTDNDLDTAATAEAGDAQPYVEGNVLEGILERQWPAPGLEDVLVEVIDGVAPEVLRDALNDLTPEGYAALVEALTPLGLVEQLEQALGQEPIVRDAVNEGVDQVAGPVTGGVHEGVGAVGGGLSEVLTQVAPGAIPNPGIDYGQLSQVPLPDEPLLDLGGDETGPPAPGEDAPDLVLPEHRLAPAPPPGASPDGVPSRLTRLWSSLLSIFD